MGNTTTLTLQWGETAFADSNGSGTPLFFLHGTGCDSADWTSVTERLPQNQRYITLDFRGHGQSSTPTDPFTIENIANDVLKLVDSLSIPKLVLIGHSLGGMVAMEAAKRSSCVVGLILLEGWTSLSNVRHAFDRGRFYGALSQTDIDQIQQKSQKTRPRFEQNVWERFWTSVRAFDAYTYLEQAQIPIYEVFGEMGRNDSTDRLLRIPPNPNIQWKWVPNAGHYLPHECPAQIAKICCNFIETTH